MKIFTIKPLIIALVAVIILTGCQDGDQGPAGTDGTNGVGFEEALEKGNVLVYLDGTRPDGVAFKDTLDFRFSSSDLNYSYLYRYDPPSDSDNYTYLKRYLGFNAGGGYYDDPEGGYAETWSEVWFYSPNAGDTSIWVELGLNTSIAFPEDHKYFDLDDYYYFASYHDEVGEEYSYGNVTDSTFTAYSYTGSTGSLKYKASFTVPADYNSSGYDLKVTYITDATVYESLTEYNDGRSKSKSASTERIAVEPKKVAKAVMKDME